MNVALYLNIATTTKKRSVWESLRKRLPRCHFEKLHKLKCQCVTFSGVCCPQMEWDIYIFWIESVKITAKNNKASGSERRCWIISWAPVFLQQPKTRISISGSRDFNPLITGQIKQSSHRKTDSWPLITVRRNWISLTEWALKAQAGGSTPAT